MHTLLFRYRFAGCNVPKGSTPGIILFLVVLPTVASAQEFKNWQSLHSSSLDRLSWAVPSFVKFWEHLWSFNLVYYYLQWRFVFVLPFHFRILAFILRSFSATENCIIGHLGR